MFLAMHIPIVAFIDQNSPKHMVDNVVELYEVLGCQKADISGAATVSRQSTPTNYFPPESCSRQVVNVGAHTHTNDNMLPGENFEGFNTALGDRSGGPIPFHQVILGASSGSK